MNRTLIYTTIISLVVCIFIKEFYFSETAEDKALQTAYSDFTNRIHHQRLQWEQAWKHNTGDRELIRSQAKQYLYKMLTDSSFYYWYGTRYDFNGTTEKPQQGQIACGYFVTTTLSHLSFYLPRRKLAQQAASVIIRTLCDKNSIQVFNTRAKLKKYMNKQPQGVYILGLDTHVGFMWKAPDGLWFVHSSYSGNKQVSKEKWNESTVISKSKAFYIGALSENKHLIEDWIQGKSITIAK